MDLRESFSSWFREQLRRKGLSQRTFALRHLFPPSTVHDWYHGKRLPDPLSARRIADALDKEPEEIYALLDYLPPSEDYDPGDPRADLTVLVRRVPWNAEREAIARAMLEAMIRAGKEKG